jgi:hypothetical protein
MECIGLTATDINSLGLCQIPLGEPEGLHLSRSVSVPNSQISIASGRAVILAANGKRYIASSASTTIRLDLLWGSGGSRFSGTVTGNQWWHVFMMRHDTTAAITFGFDTDVNGSNKPTAYSVRRIGSIKTDGAGNILNFRQIDNAFYWMTEIFDISAAIPTTATLYTVSVPPNVFVEAIVRIASGLPTSPNANVILVSSPLINDQAPNRLGLGPASVESAYVAGGVEFEASAVERILTLSGQVRARATWGSYIHNARIGTIGWIDPRGKF